MRLLEVILAAASLASAAVAPTADEQVVYDGFKIFRVNATEGLPSLKSKIASLAQTLELHSYADHMDVAVAPSDVAAFEALNLPSDIVDEDLGASIAAEGPLVGYSSIAEVGASALPSDSWFNNYHPYSDHLNFLRDLQSALPQNSEILEIGASYEGRQITGLHLWGSGGSGSKPAIYIHGTVHAREWIATMVVEYFAYQLVSGYSNNATIKGFLDSYDFYFFPVVNPDVTGFSYTQSNDRLWRKNRMPRSGTSVKGTDINRNWPYKWEVSGGASTNPSAEDYKGQAAGDTPEVKVLKAFTDKLAAGKGITLYIDFHSYGQYILLPYGYTCSKRSSNDAKQEALAGTLQAAIAKPYGKRFTYGPICSTLYAATGGSTDYMTDVAGTTYAWAVELRGGGSGSSGFVLPASQIRPSSIEIWQGMQALIPSL
ncbi:hypothetical protein PG993_001117 [Apiospora rasikravindrae]|uniref:Peptidase M14 domain-containing protein n=1 Tax=Apiospora rasikravindrae TaxID=990691 RepID=A0ABR1UAJ3_9PEZI